MTAAIDFQGLAAFVMSLAALIGAITGLVIAFIGRGQNKVIDTKVEAVQREVTAERHERRNMAQTVSTLAFMADPAKVLPAVPTWPPKSEEKKP